MLYTCMYFSCSHRLCLFTVPLALTPSLSLYSFSSKASVSKPRCLYPKTDLQKPSPSRELPKPWTTLLRSTKP